MWLDDRIQVAHVGVLCYYFLPLFDLKKRSNDHSLKYKMQKLSATILSLLFIYSIDYFNNDQSTKKIIETMPSLQFAGSGVI